MAAPIAVLGGGGAWRVGLTNLSNTVAMARSPILFRLNEWRACPHLGESIFPRKGPPNQHPIHLGADGEPRELASPIFELGEAAMALPEERQRRR